MRVSAWTESVVPESAECYWYRAIADVSDWCRTLHQQDRLCVELLWLSICLLNLQPSGAMLGEQAGDARVPQGVHVWSWATASFELRPKYRKSNPRLMGVLGDKCPRLTPPTRESKFWCKGPDFLVNGDRRLGGSCGWLFADGQPLAGLALGAWTEFDMV